MDNFTATEPPAIKPVTIDDLRTVHAFSELPDEHLQWILQHGEAIAYSDGETLMKTGEPANYMFIILEGRVSFYMDVNGKLVHYFDFENDKTTGGVSGLLPYSRMKTAPGTAFANGHLKGYRLNKEFFPELERLNPDLIQKLIGYMTERARTFATIQLQHEKVSALGKLSAGIAHELNNPAAAINRISAELTKRTTLNNELTEKLLALEVKPGQVHYINDLIAKKETEQKQMTKPSTMQLMQREDELNDWMNDNGYTGERLAGETFSESGFSVNDLEGIEQKTGKAAFLLTLQWIENILSTRHLLKDLQDASCRISDLVGAIKSHVHMDRTSDMQATKINKDLDNTLTLLGYKLREKNIMVHKNYDPELPELQAYIGELNQVWTNLIDNAIFALEKDGELTISTSVDKKNIKVTIADNGSGIPKEIQSRIFDPFFTTKKVGQGTGIGLDLVQRIVKHHQGEVKLYSIPGKTEFTVCLPIAHSQPEVTGKQ
jgi:signal transduction histidine kinase